VRRAGQRAADPGRAPGEKRAKDAALTVASLVPAGLFWVMVLAGSFHGLVAFGRSTLGWRNGWEYLVPGTLDGVSVTFAMLALRAVRKGKTPTVATGWCGVRLWRRRQSISRTSTAKAAMPWPGRLPCPSRQRHRRP
jgi:hypothetical protein